MHIWCIGKTFIYFFSKESLLCATYELDKEDHYLVDRIVGISDFAFKTTSGGWCRILKDTEGFYDLNAKVKEKEVRQFIRNYRG
jgi:hypothetical protein